MLPKNIEKRRKKNQNNPWTTNGPQKNASGKKKGLETAVFRRSLRLK